MASQVSRVASLWEGKMFDLKPGESSNTPTKGKKERPVNGKPSTGKVNS